jgi:hypothetical protein
MPRTDVRGLRVRFRACVRCLQCADVRGGRPGRYPHVDARYLPTDPLRRVGKLRGNAGGRLWRGPLLSGRTGGAGPATRRAVPAAGRVPPAGVRLLPADARGSPFCALGRRPAGPAQQAALLPEPGQDQIAGRLHCAGLRPQPRRYRGPHPTGLSRAGRPMQSSGHGNGIRFLRSTRQHRFAADNSRAARQPPAPVARHGATGFQELSAGMWHYTLASHDSQAIYDIPIE